MLYKKFGGDNFTAQMVGEAKLRQLKQVDVPYLSASGPGFVAKKRGDTNEVWLEEGQEGSKERIPDFAVFYASGWTTAYKLDGKFSFNKIPGIGAAGEYVGDGEFIHYSPPEISITNGEQRRPLYSAVSAGAIFPTSIFSKSNTTSSQVVVHEDLKVIPYSNSHTDRAFTRPVQGYYVELGGSGWDNSIDMNSHRPVAPWKGVPVFCGVVGRYKVVATPGIINDGTGDDMGMYRGVGVVDIHLTKRAGRLLKNYGHRRIHLDFPGSTQTKANEVTGTITVISPGVFVVLSAQTFNTDGLWPPKDIYLWHTLVTVSIDDDGEMQVETKTYKLFTTDATTWSTPSEHYSMSEVIEEDHRINSQAPSVLCEDGESVIYAMSPYKSLGIPGSTQEYCCVAYVKVELTGRVVSGFVTKPEITIANPIRLSETKLVMSKGTGIPAACDLLFVGNSTILSRVREFESPLTVQSETTINNGRIRYPQTVVPPTPYHNRVELWISRDDGATWSVFDGDLAGVEMSVATVGIPSIVEPPINEVDGSDALWPTVVVPVRRGPMDGDIEIFASKDGLISFEGPVGKYKFRRNPKIDEKINGGKFDLFSMNGDHICHPEDTYLYSRALAWNIFKDDEPNEKGATPYKMYTPLSVNVGDPLKVPTMVRVAPNADSKSLKMIARVAINGKLTPKDLVRPWVYDPAYKKPEEP